MSKDTVKTGEFNQLISNCYHELTRSEKRIATYLEQNQNEAAFLTSLQMAERLQLSEATVIRFARTLGFKNYPDMRVALQENFRRRITHSVRLRSRLEDLQSVGDPFERFVNSEVDYLMEAQRTVDRKALSKAVELLRTHERIFAFGVGPSLSLVNLLDIRLTRLGHYVIPVSTAGREMLEPMLVMRRNDLLIAYGFFSFSPYLQLIMEHAYHRKAQIILITDTLGTLVGDMADVILSAPRGPISSFHSLIVPMTITNALLLELSALDEEKVLNNLDELDQLRQKLAHSLNNTTK
jgi:DNA-binding MurR/RpiR family transcriptional regulator